MAFAIESIVEQKVSATLWENVNAKKITLDPIVNTVLAIWPIVGQVHVMLSTASLYVLA